MAAVKVQLEHRSDCSLGEGPHWDDATQTLIYVDINNSLVCRWNPATKQRNTVRLPDRSVGAVVPRRKGGLVVAAAHRFAALDESTGHTDTLHEIQTELPGTRFNDGKCDPAGRFWAGTMGEEVTPANPNLQQGILYCLDTDGKCHQKVAPVDISNGLSWSADGTVMYYTDSLKFCIDAYDYDINSGSISNCREVVHFVKEVDGIPDGHAIDVDGNLWVAMFFGGQLIKVDPRRGEKIDRIKVSDTAVKTTSVCFGGANLDEMYVTSARNLDLKGNDDTSGGIFKITGTGARGFAANMYEG